MSYKTLVLSMNQRFSTRNVHFVLNGDIYNNNNNKKNIYMNIVRMILCSYCIQMYRSDITTSSVHSDNISTTHLLPPDAASYFLCSVWRFVLSEQSCEEFWQQRLGNSGDRPEGINHECQPLTLSVWSLGHSWAWWSLPGNEFQKAASIIHTYKSTVCPLFLEMRLNEGRPYLVAVLLICRWVACHFCWWFQPPTPQCFILSNLLSQHLHDYTHGRWQVLLIRMLRMTSLSFDWLTFSSELCFVAIRATADEFQKVLLCGRLLLPRAFILKAILLFLINI